MMAALVTVSTISGSPAFAADVQLTAIAATAESVAAASAPHGSVAPVNSERISPERLSGTFGVGLGSDIRIAIDGADNAARKIVDGRAVYVNSASAASTVVAADEQTTQIMTVIDGPSAPTAYAYTFQFDPHSRLALTSAGGVVIENGATVVGYVEAPWATDADGRNVATHFEIDGDVLIQYVNHRGAAYPVTADPSVSAGKFWYVRYSKQEVKAQNVRLAEMGNDAFIALVCGGLAKINGALGAVCGAAIGGQSSSVTGQVRDAAKEGKCILHRYTIVAMQLVAWEKYSC